MTDIVEPWPQVRDLLFKRFTILSYRLVDEHGRVVFFSGGLRRLNGNTFEIRDGEFRFEMRDSQR